MRPVDLLVAPVVRATIARHAVPAGTAWRDRCDNCLVTLRRTVLLPSGRCRSCRCRVGPPPYLVEVVVLGTAVLLALGYRSALQTAAFAWWAAYAVALSFVDAAVHRLPDRLTVRAAAGVLALLGADAVAYGDAMPWLRALAAGACAGAVFAALTLLLGPRGPGLGDAKFLVATGAVLGWLGWRALLTGLVLAVVGQAGWAIALLATRRAGRSTYLPLGPFLTAGALAVIATWST